MRKIMGLALAGCVLLTACKKDDPSGSVNSSAPPCSAADALLLKIDSINENVGMQGTFQSALQSMPDATRENVVSRINAKVAADGARMRAPEGGLRQWIALLLLSSKTEARAVEDFRYCNGDFDFGNGQRWHWVYSMSNGANGPEMRINSAEVTAGGTMSVPAAPPAASEAQAPDAEPVTAEAADAAAATEESQPERGDVAEDLTDAAPPPSYDAQAAARDREREQIAEERRQMERERRELARQKQLAAAQRDAEAMAARDAQARAWREQQEAARRGPTADDLYESRRSECPRGFLGTDCRNRVKQQVCSGHWSSSPELGYSKCKTD